MAKEYTPACVFDTHAQAQDAIRTLSESGFDLRKLAIVGNADLRQTHRPTTSTGGTGNWGGVAMFWANIWGQLAAPALYWAPWLTFMGQTGPTAPSMFGPWSFMAWPTGAARTPASTLAALQARCFLLVVQGTAQEQQQVRTALTHTQPLADD